MDIEQDEQEQDQELLEVPSNLFEMIGSHVNENSPLTYNCFLACLLNLKNYNLRSFFYVNFINIHYLKLDQMIIDASQQPRGTPIGITAALGDVYGTRTLIQQGVDTSAKKISSSPLITACLDTSNDETAQVVLEAAGVNINVIFEDRTPWMLAILNSRFSLLKKMISLTGFAINKQPPPTFCSPLNFAISCDNYDAARLLLRHPGLDINAQDDKHGTTALIFAILRNNFSSEHEDFILEMLQHPDIDINIFCRKEGDALNFAWVMRRRRIFEELLRCPHVRVFSDSASTWHSVLLDGSFDLARLILCHTNLDVNASVKVSQEHLTALLILIKIPLDEGERVTEIEEFTLELLDHPHIDVNIPDQDGCTPLMLAAARGMEFSRVVAKLLSMPSTDLFARALDGRTALDAAHVSVKRAIQDAMDARRHNENLS
eukprot:gene28368-34250_t